MSLKDVIADEISRVFLNPEEFGERHELAGHADVLMVVETDDIGFPESSSDDRPGVAYEWLTLHVAKADVPDRFLPGKETSFDHEQWFVNEVSEAGGMAVIKLYRELA